MALEQLKLVVDAVDNASGVLGGIGSALGRVGDIVGTAVVGAFAAGGAAVAAFGATSLKNAADFEQSMNMLQAVSGATGAQMAALSAKAIQLGADMTLPNTSAKDAAEAMTELAKAGLSVDQTMAAAKGTLQLAAAAQVSNAEAAKIAANALNTFGLEGSEATRVADLLAATANSSSAEIRDVAASLQMSGAVAAQAKIPIEDLTTAIGMMANKGIAGSDAGTSLKTMIMRLTSPTKEAASAMQELGVQIYDADGKMRPLEQIIGQFNQSLYGTSTAMTTVGGRTAEQNKQLAQYQKELAAAQLKISEFNSGLRGSAMSADAKKNAIAKLNEDVRRYQAHISELTGIEGKAISVTKQLTDEQRQQALTTIFGSDAIRAASILFGEGADSFDKMRTAVTKAGAAQELARAQTRGLNGAIDGLKSVLETAGLVLAGPFLKPLTEVVLKLGDFVSSLPIEEMAAFAAAALASGDPLGMVVGKLMELTGGLGAAQAGLGGLATFITATFGPVLNSLQALFATVFGMIQTSVTEKLGLVTSFVEENGTELTYLFQSIWDGLTLIVATAINTITAILQALAPYLQAIFGQISLFVQAHGAEIVQFLQTAWDTIVSIITLALQLIQAIVVPILTAIAQFINQHGAEIQLALSTVWTVISTIVQAALTVILSVIAAALMVISGNWEAAWQAVQNIFETVWNALVAIATSIATAIGTFIATWLASVQANWNTIWLAIQTFLEGAMTYIRDTIITPILTAIQTAWNTVLTFIKDNIVTPIFTAIQTFIQTLLAALFGRVLQMLQAHRADFLQIYSDIKLIVETLMTRARDFLVGIWTQIYNWFVKVLTTTYELFRAAWTAIANLIDLAQRAIWKIISDVWAQITAWIGTTMETIRKVFEETWANVLKTIGEALKAIYEAIITTMQKCVKAIFDFAGQFAEAGRAIVKGAEQGVWDAANALLAAVVQAMINALNAAKRALGIGSPSREFARGVGLPIMQGVGVGIEAGAPAVERTLTSKMAELVDVAIGGAEGIAAGIGDIFDGIDLPSLGFGGGTGLSKELKALVDKAPGLLDVARELNSVGGNMQSLDISALMWMDNLGVTEDQIKAIADWVKNGMPQGLGGELGSSLFGGLGDESKKLLEEIKTTLGEMRDMMKEMLGQMRDGMRFYFDDMMRIQITRLDTMRQKFVEFSNDMVGMAAWTGGKVSEGIAGAWAAMAAPAPAYVTPTPGPSLWEGGRRGEGGGQTVNINATVRDDQDAELLARRVAVILQTR